MRLLQRRTTSRPRPGPIGLNRKYAILKRLPISASDEDLRGAVEEWVDLLAAGRFRDAAAWLYSSPGAEKMTADRIEALVQEDWWDKPEADGKHIVTPRAEATGGGPRCSVIRLDADPSAGNIHYDLPLDGQWSSLTAILDFKPDGDTMVISLHDMHVLWAHLRFGLRKRARKLVWAAVDSNHLPPR